MEPGGLRAEHMNWNMMPGLFKRMPGLPTLTVKLLVWEKWCKEPYTQWEPTQHPSDFYAGIALVIYYSKYQDLPKDNLWDQIVVSMTLTYVPEHWQLVFFQESSYVINAARDEGDPHGMISLTHMHKKAPFIQDISYWEYGQHMTIVPLTDPDDEGLGMCNLPHDFAIGAFHSKPQGSGKSGKLAFSTPPAFQRAPCGKLLVLTRCNGKTWGGTSSVPDWHKVPMAPLDTFMRLHTTNGILVLPTYAFALCQLGAWPFQSTMDLNILPEACLAYDTLADSENPLEDAADAEPDTNDGSGKKHCKCKGKSKTWSKSAGASSSASEASPSCKNQTPWVNAALAKQVAQDLHLSSDGSDSKHPEQTNRDTPAVRDSQSSVGMAKPDSGTNPSGTSATKSATLTVPPEKDPDAGKTMDPTQEEGEDA